MRPYKDAAAKLLAGREPAKDKKTSTLHPAPLSQPDLAEDDAFSTLMQASGLPC